MEHSSALRTSGRRRQCRVRTIRHYLIPVSVVLAALSIPAAFGRGDTAADTLSGPARVIDGDTIDVAGERVRLSGIDALERNQRCRDGAGRSYRCGAEAAAALKRRIGGEAVRCEATIHDRYGRAIAICFAADDTDLNGWLVRQGHALAYRRYSRAYVGDEEVARRNRRGMWNSEFVPPWRWRKGVRLPDAHTSTDAVVRSDGGTPDSESGAPSSTADALARWDDDANGRISCKEARRHRIAPVRRGHSAYPFMRDGDSDGVVCE